ncbi:MAG: winged helix-turn-helix transcriptional regulator, partial [Polyangiales bacterium]
MMIDSSDSNAAQRVCPVDQALDLVASKWAAFIVFQLHEHQVIRFRELQRAIGKITQKELTKQLRKLERFGLVHREIFAEVPPRVEYRLTPLGRTLVGPLTTLSQWSSQYGKSVEAHRKRFDAAAEAALV